MTANKLDDFETDKNMVAAFVALDDLEHALNKDFKHPTWSKDVMSAATLLCGVIDRLRHKIEGGQLQ
jgi:hypothetical protein